MAAAQQYIAASNDVGYNKWHEFNKPGFFNSDADIVRRVRKSTGTVGCRHPITYLVEAADDIVYCAVDLEDGIRRGVLIWNEVETKLRSQAHGSPLLDKIIHAAQAHAAPLKSYGKAYFDALAQAFRVAALSALAVEARRVFNNRYKEIMNGEYHNELVMDSCSEAAPIIKACKYVLRTDLYRHRDILSLELRGRKVIHDLLGFFWEAVEDYDHLKRAEMSPKSYYGKLYFLISDNYRRCFETRMEDATEIGMYCKLQLITDQVAGMTDTYACELHRRLTNG